MEDRAGIRRLHRAEKMPIRAVARHLGISKNTMKRALASDRVPAAAELAGVGSGLLTAGPVAKHLADLATALGRPRS